MQSCVMDGAAPEVAARVDTGACAAAPPEREAVLRLAAELLDPILLAAGFQRAAPGHWTGTRFAWHEDVLVELARPSGRAFTVEIFAGVPRRGIGDPVPGTPFALALDGPAREAMRQRLARTPARRDRPGLDLDHPDERAGLPVADEADLRAWLAFVAEHLPAAIARVRDHAL